MSAGKDDFLVDLPREPHRRKTAPQPGHSLRDWGMSLMKTPDRRRRPVSKAEVMQHGVMGDMWMVFKGMVYDVSAFALHHPGGSEVLLPVAGRDCTVMYNKYHPWVQFDAMLAKHAIGPLDPSLDAPAAPPPAAPLSITPPPSPSRSPGSSPRKGFKGTGRAGPTHWKKGEPLTPELIASSRTRERCWVVLYGRVYDVTAFMGEHPGGDQILLEHGGTDASAEFEVYHSAQAKAQLQQYFIGEVPKTSGSLLTPFSHRHKPPPPPLLRLLRRTDLTHDTVRLVFSAPHSPRLLPGGHILLRLEGVLRPYTPVRVSAGELEIVVKAYPEGRVSKALHQLQEGVEVEMQGPQSCRFVYSKAEHKKLVLVAGGTGASPILTLAQAVCQDSGEAVVVISDKEKGDALLSEEFSALASAHPSGLKLRRIFTRESEQQPPLKGDTAEPLVGKRIDAEFVRSLMTGEGKGSNAVVVCGPPSFNEDVTALFKGEGCQVTTLT
eukprot:Hpha_TRINITY_DN15519_c3_g13::TRINITY_DN15519_c3_g13_i1::g.105110::m.105110/K00326/E1.6.2.2; cytochrome-b5 reductase